MKDFNKYFIVGTNSDALHDTMNGTVIGELIRCKDCTHQHTNTITGMKQCLLPNGYTPLGDDNDYCSYAERKPPQVNPEMVKALKDRIEKQRGKE